LVATWNPAASASYYLQAAYYLGGHEPAGLWYSPTADFGLVDTGTVDQDVFEHLFAGRDKYGKQLVTGGRIDRTGAFDITYSAPRSISLLWALGTTEQRMAIEAAHLRAVRKSLDLVQAEACWARRGHGGSRIERVALTAAIFRHGESRPAEHVDAAVFADPNLHCHVVVMNLAKRDDGTVGALHSKILRGFKMAAGSAYHAALAHEMEQLGYGIDRISRNGIFEIVGVADSHIHYFSARRAEIENELTQAGICSKDNAALAAAVARRSRKAKNSDVQDRHAQWREIARSHGLHTLPLPSGAADHAHQRRGLTGQALFADRLAALPRAMTETTSLIDRRELFRAVGEALVGTGLGAEHIDLGVAKLLSQGLVLELGNDGLGLPRYSTPEMIAIEREVVAMAERILAAPAAGLDPVTVTERCDALGLSAEQAAAATAATGSRKLTVIEGAPGTGKTTALTPIVEAWRAAGYQVLGAATAWRTANKLGNDLDIPARATASWLAREATGQAILNDKSLLVVDEAGLLSSREMHGILQSVERSGARLLLVGDRGQLQAIGAGAGLSLVIDAAAASHIRTVVRQRDSWLRSAIADFGRGRAADALKAFENHELLVEADGPQAAIGRVVDCVEEHLVQRSGEGALIIARTNAEVAAISAEVRMRLKQAHIINGAEIDVETVTPSGHPNRIALACGDRIRFLVRNDRLNVVNGTEAVVRNIEPGDTDGQVGAIIEAEIAGRFVRFNTNELNDAQGRARLGWAYASTVYGAQGATVEAAAVLLTPSFDRHHIYVAASRSRGSTTLVVDLRALDGLVRDDGRDMSADVTSAERQKVLAARLAVAHIKETTLAPVKQTDSNSFTFDPPRSNLDRLRQSERSNEYER
jgi:conjugative relaxase-like TrwC/TraI family protein